MLYFHTESKVCNKMGRAVDAKGRAPHPLENPD
jgi:hypothetical protein